MHTILPLKKADSKRLSFSLRTRAGSLAALILAGLTGGMAATCRAAAGDLDLEFGSPVAGGGRSGRLVVENGVLPSAVAAQTDGKVVAGGNRDGDFLIVCYTAAGDLDPGFHGGGILTADIGGPEQLQSIAVQPNGKIVAAGTSGMAVQKLTVARFSKTGMLDGGFGSGGKQTALFCDPRPEDEGGHFGDHLTGMALYGGGAGDMGVVLTGVSTTCDASTKDAFIGRSGVMWLSSGGAVSGIVNGNSAWSGAENPTGGADGTAIVGLLGVDEFGYFRFGPGGSGKQKLPVQPAGFYKAVKTPGGAVEIFAAPAAGGPVFRYNSGGGQIGGFSLQFPAGFDSLGPDLAVAPSGKIFVYGTLNASSLLLRYNANGSLDTSFKGTGMTSVGVHPVSGGKVLPLPDGKVLVSGMSSVNGQSRVVVERYLGDATPPLLFIPGMAGSVLRMLSPGSPEGKYLWPTVRPGNIDALNLHRNTPGVEAVDIVRRYDPFGIPGLASELVYEPLIDYLTTAGLDLREFPLEENPSRMTDGYIAAQQWPAAEKPNLFLFPYDWRQDCRSHRDQLHTYITSIRNLHGGTRVNVVAHSMGGLILRDYMLAWPEDIDKAVTIGTPVWGAPKAVYRLLTGEFYDISLVDWIAGDEMKAALASMPSVAQLIPPFQAGHISNRSLLLSEKGWDLNGNHEAAENYTPAVFWTFINRVAPGFEGYNKAWHTAARDNWSGAAGGTRWLHVCGKVLQSGRSTTTTDVEVYEKTRESSAPGRGTLSRSAGYRENKGPGDNVVPYDSAARQPEYLAPGTEPIELIESDESVKPGNNRAEHTALTRHPGVLARMAEFLGYPVVHAPPSLPAAAQGAGAAVTGRCELHLYGTSYVAIRDAAGNENTKLSACAAKKVPGLDIHYDGIHHSMQIGSESTGLYTLESPAETADIESDIIVYDPAGAPLSLKRFRFSPQDQKWRLALTASGPVVALDLDRDGVLEAGEEVAPSHAQSGIMIDLSPPKLTLTLTVAAETATLTMTATDDGGTPAIRYQQNGGPVSDYTAPLAFPLQGGQRIKAFATDTAGNTSGLIETAVSPGLGFRDSSPAQLNLEWPVAEAFVLEEAESPDGPWSPPAAAISRDEFRHFLSLPIGSENRRFFRLRPGSVSK